jgi:hypothetical protein
MKSVDKSLPLEAVQVRLLAYLAQSTGPGTTWRIVNVPASRVLPWSTIYFFDVTCATEARRFVVKIPSFPDQTVPEISWQSEELLTRGKREYDSMVRVYEHFSLQDNPQLCALRPETYLPDINAVVMDFISSGTLYDSTVAPRHLITQTGRQAAIRRLRATGEWLRWLHMLPADLSPSVRSQGPADAYHNLLLEAERLRTFGLSPLGLPRWASALDILKSAPLDQLVWSHADFHMRNVYVQPGETILSIDTALDHLDSPCVDLAKMIVDLQTRRVRILTQGLIPPYPLVKRLIAAFLEGYGPAFNPLTLALYEGQYLLEKWAQCQVAVTDGPGGAKASVVALVTKLDINPMLHRLVTAWIRKVHRLAS